MNVYPIKESQEKTANFIGTEEDFNRYLGGFCRNLVQKITRPYKHSIGKCENCGTTEKQLDAAHIHGNERKEIISKILKSYKSFGRIQVDLEEFEERFIAEHQPIKNVIKILCKDCHREYDNQVFQDSKNDYSSSKSLKYLQDKQKQRLAVLKTKAMKRFLNSEKIGLMVKQFFKENGSNLSPLVIQKLQNKEYSKRELGCNYPVLIPNTNSRVIKGYNRYYKDEYVSGYWLCSQWYEGDKEKFLKWQSNL